MEAVKRKTASVISKIVGLLLAAVFILPVIILLLNVCKPLGEILSNPFSLPTSFYLDNIVYVIDNMNYPRMLVNTIFCAVLVVVISVIISAMCGYKLSRTNDKKSKILLSVLMAAMMLPFQSIMLPISRVANTLHLNDRLYSDCNSVLCSICCFSLSWLCKGNPSKPGGISGSGWLPPAKNVF